jgi:hypothetical protein
MPPGQPPWGWTCGFYPGSDPEEHTAGVAMSFDQARAALDAAWRVFLGKRTEVDFQPWRDQEARTEQRYARWKNGERLSTQKPNALVRCPCGEVFDSHRVGETVVHIPHITAFKAGGCVTTMVACRLCDDSGWVCETHPDRPLEGSAPAIAAAPARTARDVIR